MKEKLVDLSDIRLNIKTKKLIIFFLSIFKLSSLSCFCSTSDGASS